MWRAWTLSQAYRSLPSEIYGIEESHGPFLAWCFDNAVYEFGSALQGELESVTGKDAKQKRVRLLGKWLQLPDAQCFRNPMATKAKKKEGTG